MAKKKLFPRVFVGVVLLLVVTGTSFMLHPLWFFDRYQIIYLRFHGVESHEVLIDGNRIHYYVRGPEDGSPIVLVHGLGGRAEDWSQLAPYLARAGYRVYTPDLLGFGQSEEPVEATYSVTDQADLVVKFFDATGLSQPDLAGWSMGGWIVQKVAVDHPERVRRLAIVDSAGLRVPPSWDTRLFTPTTPYELRQLDALLTPHPPALPGFLTMDILRVSKQSSWVVKRALASMLTAQDVMDKELPSLHMPVLLLWGDQDRITPLSEGKAMHALIPQSRLAIAQGCGHLAPEQCAAQYGPELVRFLRADPVLPPETHTL